MKNKQPFVFLLMLFCAVFLCAAENAQLKKPGPHQVMLIGKVGFSQSINSDFYIATLGIPAFSAGEHRYQLINNNEFSYSNGQPPSTVLNDYFFIVIDVYDEEEIVFLEGFRVFLFNRRKAWLNLPFEMNVRLSPETPFVYIGSYLYSFAGDNFMVDGIETLDEFDEVQAILNTKLDEEVQLTRAVLLEPEE